MTIDYKYLGKLIGDMTGVPIRVYAGGERFYYSLSKLPADPMTACADKIMAIDTHIGYFITPDFEYYGIVNGEDIKIIIGPSSQMKQSDQALKELAFRCDVPEGLTAEFMAGMRGIVRLPLNSVIMVLCAMNYIVNGEKLGLSDIIIFDDEQKILKNAAEQESAERGFDADIAEAFGRENVHNTLGLEQTIIDFVRRGDREGLNRWIAAAPAVRAGVLAADQLRQLKNTFIVTATLVSRAAISGGMDADDALSLSDAYIQKCELLGDMGAITNLQYRMVMDYTERMERLRRGKNPSRLVLDVANYVRHHLSEPITTEDVAAALFLSRSRLSVKFKKESGENLVDFILKEKVTEAKRLLRYTDKTAVAISSYLGFSSQSHFSRVFKKYAGCLPGEYRASPVEE